MFQRPTIPYPGDTQVLSDLEWLLGNPHLMLQNGSVDASTPAEPLQDLDLEPTRRFFRSRASYRVGYYAESLLEVCLRSQKEVSGLNRALQIRKEKTTLGELDFLFRRETKLCHLEVALKFYLYHPEGSPAGSHLIGPNASDHFEKKRDALFGKQLEFGRRHFPEIEESSALMKGMLFYPPDVNQIDSLPAKLNPSHARGRWIRTTDLDWLSESEGFIAGRILEKPFWLSGQAPNGHEVTTSLVALRDELYRRVQQSGFPACLSLLGPNGCEVTRAFVVHDRWPEQREAAD
ncbi:MAG: DUF1853 family protein [Verrucomicrobiota bacterium]